MNLFKSFSVYTATQIINKGIGFFLLPVFTLYLSTTDYGILSLYTTIMSVLMIITMMGTDGGIRRQYFKLEESEFGSYVSSVIPIPLVIFVGLSLIIIVGAKYIKQWFDIPVIWIYLMPVFAMASILPRIQSGLYRVKEQPIYFSIFNLSHVLINVGVGLFLIIILKMTWDGRLYGIFLADLIFTVVVLYLLVRNNLVHGKIKKDYLKYSVSYGLPLVPHHLGAFIVNSSDRFFIAEIVSVSELGIYSVAYTVGSIIMVLQDAFIHAYTPFLFKKLQESTSLARLLIVKVSYLFIIGLLLVVILLVISSPLLYKLLINSKFHGGLPIVQWVALSYFFLGTCKMFSGYLFYYEKTKYFMYLSILNVFLNLILNYFLITAYGTIGAAYATAISFFVLMALTLVISTKLVKMPWLLKK